MIKKYITTIASFCVLSNLSAQEVDTQKLNQYFHALEQNNKFMGSVAVSKDGKIAYTKALGFIDPQLKMPANNQTKYRIGSISKTFTAVLILKAVEENKLTLDQNIASYFPSIKNADKITIQNLLQHSSGIHNFTDDENYLTWYTKPKTEKEMVTIISKSGSDFEPNAKNEYSNSNYVLLSYILEKTYKTSYAHLLSEKITKPLGLKNTKLGSKINQKLNEAVSFSFKDNWVLEKETDISIPLGAGGIISTPSDLVLFSNALFNDKLLKKESRLIMQNLENNYGLGLFQFPYNDKIGFGHTGDIDGFSSIYTHFDANNLSIAISSNGSNYDNNQIGLTLLSAFYNDPFEIPNFKTYALESKDLDTYLGTYSSTEIPIKITITKDDKNLVAQATGQASFPLTATDQHIFQFDKANIVLEFDPKLQTLILKQGGGKFTFNKEK